MSYNLDLSKFIFMASYDTTLSAARETMLGIVMQFRPYFCLIMICRSKKSEKRFTNRVLRKMSRMFFFENSDELKPTFCRNEKFWESYRFLLTCRGVSSISIKLRKISSRIIIFLTIWWREILSKQKANRLIFAHPFDFGIARGKIVSHASISRSINRKKNEE